MRSGAPLFAVILTQIFLLAACGKEFKKEESAPQEKRPSREAESAAKLLEYEHKIKAVARDAPFIVSIRTTYDDIPSTSFVTGFFVDSRGYIVTARHAYSGETRYTYIETALAGGRAIRLRIVGEIQTLDMAVLATDAPITFPVAVFGDPAAVMERGKYYGSGSFSEQLDLEKRIVAVRCVSGGDPYGDDFPLTGRIFVGELSRWEKYGPEISFYQRQQDMAGCSGAPIINLKGEVLGMVRSSMGDVVYGMDALSISEGAFILIKEDVEKRGLLIKPPFLFHSKFTCSAQMVLQKYIFMA